MQANYSAIEQRSVGMNKEKQMNAQKIRKANPNHIPIIIAELNDTNVENYKK